MNQPRLPAVLIFAAAALFAQAPPLSEPGPTFRIPDRAAPLTLVLYGDQRFTDPSNIISADPKSRIWLVQQIAAEKPAAVLMNGDVPLNGDIAADYTVFQTETKPWRDAGTQSLSLPGQS